MNRTPAASVSARPHFSSKPSRALGAYALLRRMSAGRWPLWKILGTRPPDRVLVAAVQWVRGGAPCFAVAHITLDGTEVSWVPQPSMEAAICAVDGGTP